MKINFRRPALGLCLALLLLFIVVAQPCFQMRARAQQPQNAPQLASLKVNTRDIGGAYELTAETLLYGNVKVYLPDDMAAGDTISGTVVAEPKGSTEEERARNQGTLEGYVVEIGDQKVSAAKGQFTWVVPQQAQAKPRHLIRIIEGNSGKEVANAPLTVLDAAPAASRPQTIASTDFQLPGLGQQGRPVEINGPFDGKFENTNLAWSAVGANTEAASGDFRLLAESPRKAVFRSPVNFTGPAEIGLKEGNVEARGLFRNLGVGLSVPKTNLMKGERTTLTINVVGLAGIGRGVPLLLETRGTVTMDGGNSQLILISPATVSGPGVFTMTRMLTAQQAGGFAVTASIFPRPLDACLQGDKGEGSFLLNSATGDYIAKQTDGANLTGRGTLAKKGCIITLTHNTLDRRVQAKLDQCKNEGNATVESSSPKAKFTIADKNTADSVCLAP